MDNVDEKSLMELEAGFEVDIFNALARRLQFRLNTPTQLNCTMQVERAPRLIPFIGDETFKLISAVTVNKVDKNDGTFTLETKFRLAPTERQEYKYTEVVKSELHRFRVRLADKTVGFSDWMVFSQLLEMAMDERDDKTALTYRQMVNKVLDVERAKVMQQGLSHHADFGSW